MQGFKIPTIAGVVYNENQIMIIPDVLQDPGWKHIEITYGNGATLSVYNGKEEVAVIMNRKLVPMMVACNDFYVGWLTPDGNLQQREIDVNTISLFPQ